MKTYLICFLLVATFVGSTLAQKVSREETEIRAAIDSWAVAVRARDQKALDAIFADDLFIIDLAGGTRGKKEELEVLKPSATMTTSSVINEDLRVKVIGKTNAVVTGLVKMTFEVGGKQGAMSMRYTSVWEKRKGNWQLIVLQSVRAAK